MNLLKFLLYASAISIVMGIISEDEEMHQYIRDLFKEFKPAITKFFQQIENFFYEESNLDFQKANLIATSKIRQFEKFLTIILNNSKKKLKTKQNKKITLNEVELIRHKLDLIEAKIKQQKNNKKA